jgi:UDP-glucose 4-epimerase
MVVFGDGEQTRDFTFVSDVARGIVAAGTAPDVVGETLNLGSGRELTINALADRVRSVAGRPDAPLVYDAPRPGDVRRLCADASRARARLGFTPIVTLDEGLARLRDWYTGQAESPAALLERETVHNWEDDRQRA